MTEVCAFFCDGEEALFIGASEESGGAVCFSRFVRLLTAKTHPEEVLGLFAFVDLLRIDEGLIIVDQGKYIISSTLALL